jgi:hypothetical protein
MSLVNKTKRVVNKLAFQTPGEKKIDPMIRKSSTYVRGQAKAGAAGAAAGAAGTAGLMATRGGDDDSETNATLESAERVRAAEDEASDAPEPRSEKRQSFNEAFAAARKAGKETFRWTDKSGKTGTYTTEMKGASAPSRSAPPSKKATQYSDESKEPDEVAEYAGLPKGSTGTYAKGGSVRKPGKMPAKMPMRPGAGLGTGLGRLQRFAKGGAVNKSGSSCGTRMAKGGAVRGSGAAVRGSRACKMY